MPSSECDAHVCCLSWCSVYVFIRSSEGGSQLLGWVIKSDARRVRAIQLSSATTVYCRSTTTINDTELRQRQFHELDDDERVAVVQAATSARHYSTRCSRQQLRFTVCDLPFTHSKTALEHQFVQRASYSLALLFYYSLWFLRWHVTVNRRRINKWFNPS